MPWNVLWVTKSISLAGLPTYLPHLSLSNFSDFAVQLSAGSYILLEMFLFISENFERAMTSGVDFISFKILEKNPCKLKKMVSAGQVCYK